LIIKVKLEENCLEFYVKLRQASTEEDAFVRELSVVWVDRRKGEQQEMEDERN
jgi:hypothetical protein